MAGHSKWANIQFRKKAQDSKRGKLFTKFIREITTAARMGGGDPDSNPRLRTALDKAFSSNMTKETVDRAVKRGMGAQDGANYDEIRYEGYGPGGAAVLVECLTDNRNRTVAEVRHAFSKMGGNLGASGSVAYLFKKLGVASFADNIDEDALMEVAIEAGAEDVVENADGSVDVLTSAEDFLHIKQVLNDANMAPEQAEITMRADTSSALQVDDAEKMIRLLEMLEDLDDVQNVYSNAEISDEILAQL